ncbi:MAG: ParA family protein [Jatrophihabitans sp.]|uniref:ParA family protein n=1 Tax=Jatrophihabitans sp. TaxID=1932789 RepID=UPI003F7F9B52
MKRLALYNIKGGVGKTTSAVNLAYLAARGGARTLLWDLDPQAAATYIFRVKPKVKGGGERVLKDPKAVAANIKATDFEHLDLLPADFTYRHMDLMLDDAKHSTRRINRVLDGLADDYDLVVLDCPPSVSLVSENVLRAADTVLSPLIPTTLSMRTLDQLTEFIAGTKRRPRLLGFFSMVDARKSLHRQIVAELPQRRGDVAPIVIPSQSLVEQMAVHRAPVPHYAPRSLVARRYEQLLEVALVP